MPHDRYRLSSRRTFDGRPVRPGSASTPTEDLASGSESSTLVIGESKPSAAELFFENSVLFDEVLDDLGLMSVDPAGERRVEQLKWEEVGHDALIVPV